MYQKTTLIGHLGRDPEMRFLPSGSPVVRFSLATSDRWTNHDGQPQVRITWWQITTYGKLAEICHQYLHKGARLLVEGRLTADPQTGGPRMWTDSHGQARAAFELIALTVRFLSPRRADQPAIDDAVSEETSHDNQNLI